MSPCRLLPVLPVACNLLKSLDLAGCLVGCSPVPSVVRNPLKTLGLPVLAGPLLRNPHTPYRPRGRGRSLGSALPSGGLAPLRRPFFCTSSPPGALKQGWCGKSRSGMFCPIVLAQVFSAGCGICRTITPDRSLIDVERLGYLAVRQLLLGKQDRQLLALLPRSFDCLVEFDGLGKCLDGFKPAMPWRAAREAEAVAALDLKESA